MYRDKIKAKTIKTQGQYKHTENIKTGTVLTQTIKTHGQYKHRQYKHMNNINTWTI